MVTATVQASKAVLNVAVLLVITILIVFQVSLWQNSAHLQSLRSISTRLESLRHQLNRFHEEHHSHQHPEIEVSFEFQHREGTIRTIPTTRTVEHQDEIQYRMHLGFILSEAVPPNGVNITELDMFNADGQIYSLRDYPQFHLREVRSATHYTVVFRPMAMKQDPAFYRAGPHGFNISYQLSGGDAHFITVRELSFGIPTSAVVAPTTESSLTFSMLQKFTAVTIAWCTILAFLLLVVYMRQAAPTANSSSCIAELPEEQV